MDTMYTPTFADCISDAFLVVVSLAFKGRIFDPCKYLLKTNNFSFDFIKFLEES